MSTQAMVKAAPLTGRPYDKLLRDLRKLLVRGRQQAELAVARQLVTTYHAVGTRLLEQQLEGGAGYGAATLQRLADDLELQVRILQQVIVFARAYDAGPPHSRLYWAHYRELSRITDPAERQWYEEQAAERGWTRRRLAEAIRNDRYEDRALGPAPEPTEGAGARIPRPTETKHVYKATVVRVVDGDTILALIDLGFQVCKHQRLRLACLDAPKLGTPEGVAARDFVRDELGRADFVALKTNKIDLYGRYVAHLFYQPGQRDFHRVFAKGRYLNQRLIDRGHAQAL